MYGHAIRHRRRPGSHTADAFKQRHHTPARYNRIPHTISPSCTAKPQKHSSSMPEITRRCAGRSLLIYATGYLPDVPSTYSSHDVHFAQAPHSQQSPPASGHWRQLLQGPHHHRSTPVRVLAAAARALAPPATPPRPRRTRGCCEPRGFSITAAACCLLRPLQAQHTASHTPRSVSWGRLKHMHMRLMGPAYHSASAKGCVSDGTNGRARSMIN